MEHSTWNKTWAVEEWNPLWPLDSAPGTLSASVESAACCPRCLVGRFGISCTHCSLDSRQVAELGRGQLCLDTEFFGKWFHRALVIGMGHTYILADFMPLPSLIKLVNNW